MSSSLPGTYASKMTAITNRHAPKTICMSELSLHATGQEETRSFRKPGRKVKVHVSVALTKYALSHSFGGSSEHELFVAGSRAAFHFSRHASLQWRGFHRGTVPPPNRSI